MLASLYSENTNKIRIELMQEFIEVGKREGAIHSSVSLETLLELLSVVGTLQASWARAGNYKIRWLSLTSFSCMVLLDATKINYKMASDDRSGRLVTYRDTDETSQKEIRPQGEPYITWRRML